MGLLPVWRETDLCMMLYPQKVIYVERNMSYSRYTGLTSLADVTLTINDIAPMITIPNVSSK